MYTNLFLIEAHRYWKLNKIPVNSSITAKDKIRIVSAIKDLQIKANATQQSIQFLVSTYAYFYTDVFRLKSFKSVHIRIQEFFTRLDIDKLPIYTNDDVELAYKIRLIWNNMNHTTSVDMPFKIRKFLSVSRVTIGKNTFFKVCNNFVHFIQIAHFVNKNKLNFPELHGVIEFFLHLPILYGPKEYCTAQYLSAMGTLDKYYKDVYSELPQIHRYPKFLEQSKDNMEHIKNSSMWCSEQLEKDLQSVLV